MADLDARERMELLRAIADVAPGDGSGAGDAVYRVMTAAMPAMLILLDPAGHFLWTNQLSHPEVLGRSMFDFMPPEEQADARAALERVLRSGRADRFTGFGPGTCGP